MLYISFPSIMFVVWNFHNLVLGFSILINTIINAFVWILIHRHPQKTMEILLQRHTPFPHPSFISKAQLFLPSRSPGRIARSSQLPPSNLGARLFQSRTRVSVIKSNQSARIAARPRIADPRRHIARKARLRERFSLALLLSLARCPLADVEAARGSSHDPADAGCAPPGNATRAHPALWPA